MTDKEQPCPVCTNVSLKRLKSINKHLEEGKRSISAIAEHYNLEVVDLQNHLLQCIGTQEGGGLSELHRTQRRLSSLIETFQEDIANGRQYEYDPENGVDGRGVINHLITAMREQRETIVAMHRLRSSEEVYEGIMQNVVGPLINAMAAITVEESKRLLDEVFDLTRGTPDQHPRIKKAVDEFLSRVGDRMTEEPTRDIREKVSAVIDQKGSNKPTAH